MLNNNSGKLWVWIAEHSTIKYTTIRNDDHRELNHRRKCLWWIQKSNVKSYLVYVLGHEDEEEVWRQCCNHAAVWEPFPPWAGAQGLLGVPSPPPHHGPAVVALWPSLVDRWGSWGWERWAQPRAWLQRLVEPCYRPPHCPWGSCVGQQTWLPAGDCLREMALCALSVLTLPFYVLPSLGGG